MIRQRLYEEARRTEIASGESRWKMARNQLDERQPAEFDIGQQQQPSPGRSWLSRRDAVLYHIRHRFRKPAVDLLDFSILCCHPRLYTTCSVTETHAGTRASTSLIRFRLILAESLSVNEKHAESIVTTAPPFNVVQLFSALFVTRLCAPREEICRPYCSRATTG